MKKTIQYVVLLSYSLLWGAWSLGQSQTDLYPLQRDSIILKVGHHYPDFSSQDRKSFEAEMIRRFYFCDSAMIESLISICGRDFYVDQNNTAELFEKIASNIQQRTLPNSPSIEEYYPRITDIQNKILSYSSPFYILNYAWDEFLDVDGINTYRNWTYSSDSVNKSILWNFSVDHQRHVPFVPKTDSIINLIKTSPTFEKNRTGHYLLFMVNLYNHRAWNDLFNTSLVFLENVNNEVWTYNTIDPSGISLSGYTGKRQSRLNSALDDYNNTIPIVIQNLSNSPKDKASYISASLKLLINSGQLSYENCNIIERHFSTAMALLKYEPGLEEEMKIIEKLHLLFLQKISQYEIYDSTYYIYWGNHIDELEVSSDFDRFFLRLSLANYWNRWWIRNTIYQTEFNDFSKLNAALHLLAAEERLHTLDLNDREFVKFKHQLLLARMDFLEMSRKFDAALCSGEEIIQLLESYPEFFTNSDLVEVFNRITQIKILTDGFFKAVADRYYSFSSINDVLSNDNVLFCIRQNYTQALIPNRRLSIKESITNAILNRRIFESSYAGLPNSIINLMHFTLSRSTKDIEPKQLSAKADFTNWYFNTFLERTGNPYFDFYKTWRDTYKEVLQEEYEKHLSQIEKQGQNIDTDQRKYQQLFIDWSQDNTRLSNEIDNKQSLISELNKEIQDKLKERDDLAQQNLILNKTNKKLDDTIVSKNRLILERNRANRALLKANVQKDSAINHLNIKQWWLTLTRNGLLALVGILILTVIVIFKQRNLYIKKKVEAENQSNKVQMLTMAFSQMGHFGQAFIEQFNNDFILTPKSEETDEKGSDRLQRIQDFLGGFSLDSLDSSTLRSIEEEVNLAREIISLRYPGSFPENRINSLCLIDSSLLDARVPLYTITNLIVNSVKHSIRTSPISVNITELKRDSHCSSIEIRDTARKKKKLDPNSNGIGLVFVQNMFKIHNGNTPTNFKIQEWDSETNGGVVVTFNIKRSI